MIIKYCEDCGVEIDSGDNGQRKRCADCQSKRRNEAARIRQAGKRAEKRVGPSSICKDCGAEFIRSSGAQKYCPTCRRKRAEGAKPKPKKKKKLLSLTEASRIANAHGLTYGQAVARGLV